MKREILLGGEESSRIESEKLYKGLKEGFQEYAAWNKKSDGWIDENYNNEHKDDLAKNKYRRAWFAGIAGRIQLSMKKIESDNIKDSEVLKKMGNLLDQVMEIITNQYARERELDAALKGSLEALCSDQEKLKSMLPENTDKKHTDLFISSLENKAGDFTRKLKKDVTGQSLKRVLYGAIGEPIVDNVFGEGSITKKHIGNTGIVIEQKEPNSVFVAFLQNIAKELNIKGKKKEFGTKDEEIDLVEKQLDELIAIL
tara:strand:+ start:58 stop:825 length:768 start_codon:yes stop_codon:yes gene_type:complete